MSKPSRGEEPTLRGKPSQTRDKLLDAAGRLLASQGASFSLPDLARTAGVSPAATYRQFTSAQDVFQAFYDRKIGQLASELAAAALVPAAPLQRFLSVSQRWTELATEWGTAAAQIRSARGFLERARQGEPHTSALYDILSPIIDTLADAGEIACRDRDYAVLLWVNVFDERGIVDLTSTLGWTSKRSAKMLSASVLAALQGDC
ncbi:hypothetical protein XU06_29400 (plasmid) [Rhodococcus erythropolis]|uniref:TetR/AcrR family transcriptional regulator n=1 Tax=Rhodococcus erythropolis TaxID=1833 RepID=UPI00061B7C19|nr:TetR/AcrR family transcriptional regulator [Rhodococcus erythropolis]AKE01096.1 hypothetical protein XU06_29400 [Rhodococcus erythropolis]